MALHGVDVTVFTDLDRSYQTEQDPVQVRRSLSLSLSLSVSVCVCVFAWVHNVVVKLENTHKMQTRNKSDRIVQLFHTAIFQRLSHIATRNNRSGLGAGSWNLP